MISNGVTEAFLACQASGMEVAKTLLLLSYLQGVYSQGQPYCTEQLGSIMVEEGGSVTLPCNFSYPDLPTPTEVRVYWIHGKNAPCGKNAIIYSHTEQQIHKDYTSRIIMVGDPQRERSATIRIQDLRRSDGRMFCCRIEIPDRGNSGKWQNINGTIIQFKDEASVEQPEIVPAIPEEMVSIPCVVHNLNHQEVRFKIGEKDLCSENWEYLPQQNHQITPTGDSPAKYVMQIKAGRSSDSRRYCCVVKTPSGISLSPVRATQVAIADTYGNGWFAVSQNERISAQTGDSVTMTCSYNISADRKPLWIGVFWRVGSSSGPYAYHPSDLMVNANYTGRTQLILPADLWIKEVQHTDSGTYYCFVIMKFCSGHNQVITVTKYGRETQLSIDGGPDIPTGDPNPGLTEQQKRGIIAGVTTMLVLMFLILVLVFLKKKGIICDKKWRKQSASSAASTAQITPASDTYERMSGNTHPAAVPQDSGGIIYADINIKPAQQGAGRTTKGTPSSSDTPVLYAVVKRPDNHVKDADDPKCIYSAVP